MANESLDVSVKVSWWLKLYIRGLALFCMLTGYEPDYIKVRERIASGIKVRLDRANRK